MDRDIAKYVKQHTLSVTLLIFSAFVLLAFGEYFLYRKTQELNRMISEGTMQIKEGIKNKHFDFESDYDKKMMDNKTQNNLER